MIVKFEKEKETKGTIRFKEVPEQGKPPVVGTLYLQRWFAEGKTEVTIEIKE